MLITQSTAEAWFRKDSFIYQQYLFLFRNPIWWKQKEPKGASLCPYFWMAMFSFFIFKPIVHILVGVGRLLKPLFIFGGKPIAAFDLWVRQSVSSDADTKPPGAGIGIVVLILAILALLTMVLYTVTTGIYSWYTTLELPVYKFVTWGIVIGILTAVTVGIHVNKNQWDSSRCRSEVYIYIWAALTQVIGAFGFPTEYRDQWVFVWNCFTACVSAVAGFVVFMAGCLWTGLKFIGLSVWGGVTAGIDQYYIPYWAIALLGFALLGAIGYIADRLYHTSDGKLTYRNSWKHMLAKAYGNSIKSVIQDALDVDYETIFKDKSYGYISAEAREYIAYKMVYEFLEKHYSDLLDRLEKQSVPMTLWVRTGKDSSDNAILIREVLGMDEHMRPSYDSVHKFVAKRLKASDMRQQVDERLAYEKYQLDYEARKREARRNSKSKKDVRGFHYKTVQVH